jgi:hypothetical protein
MSKDILFLSSNRYGDFPSRKTRFSKYLSEKGFRVVYVDSPHTYLGYLKKGFKVESYGLKEVFPNFYVLRSFPILPFFKKYLPFNKMTLKYTTVKLLLPLRKYLSTLHLFLHISPFFRMLLPNLNQKSSMIVSMITQVLEGL